MYISEIKLWNFRKYGDGNFDISKPHLTIPLSKGMNVLIGENDSGKTAIVDAIKYTLRTNTNEYIRVQNSDFYSQSTHLRVELVISEMTEWEAATFTEVIKPEEDGSCSLRLILDVHRKDGGIIPYEICAGADDIGHHLTPNMKEALHVTYLKPLRDAENELTAKRNSRLSQILQGHDLLQTTVDGKEHEFIGIIKDANQKIMRWFTDESLGETSNKKRIKDVIDSFLHAFINSNSESEFLLSDPSMRNILERIKMGIADSANPGLGTLNRLFMAAELLHLRKSGNHLRACLIEELEAHIHPQAQMKVIEGLQKERDVQFILTTHSPNVTSKIKLGDKRNSILICKGKNVFSMRPEYTLLEERDYRYLDHFLDVTKSNLFFAKGVILVEGWAEEILIPAIAQKMGIDLTQQEVSIVNVGSTAYLHFARIFLRQAPPNMNVRCSIVTDLDVPPDADNKDQKERTKHDSIAEKIGENNENVKLFIAKEWTLEWCIYKSVILSPLFKDAVSRVHNKTPEFKVDDKGNNVDSFERKLTDKLKDKSLNKVEIAQELSQMILSNKTIDLSIPDDYIKYLINAIKFATHKL